MREFVAVVHEWCLNSLLVALFCTLKIRLSHSCKEIYFRESRGLLQVPGRALLNDPFLLVPPVGVPANDRRIALGRAYDQP